MSDRNTSVAFTEVSKDQDDFIEPGGHPALRHIDYDPRSILPDGSARIIHGEGRVQIVDWDGPGDPEVSFFFAVGL